MGANNVVRKHRRPPTLQKVLTKAVEQIIDRFTRHRALDRFTRERLSPQLALQAAFDDVVESASGIRPIELHQRLQRKRSVNAESIKKTPTKKASQKRVVAQNPYFDEELQRLKDIVDGKRRG